MKKIPPGSSLSIFIFIMLLTAPLEGAFSDNFRFSRITMGKGLSNNSVFCLMQDYRGFMWLGTFSGLNRYDGDKFSIYKPELKSGSISSSVIFTIYEDSRKRLWVGTDGGGLNLYERDSDSFSSFRHEAGNLSSISSDQVYAILEDRKGNLWVGTDGGGLNIMLDDGSFTRFDTGPDESHPLKNSIIRVLYQDSAGRILAGTEGSGLAVIREGIGGYTLYTAGDRSPDQIQSNTVRAIFEDSSGRIWTGFENHGVSQFFPDRGIFTPLAFPGRQVNGLTVRAISEDSAGRLWFGTERDGIFIYSPDTGMWESVRSSDEPDSLSSDTIRSFYTDSNGHIWIGTRDGGVNLYNPLSSRFNIISNRNPEDSAGYQIREIIETPDRDIWIATDGNGLKRFSPDTGKLSTFSRLSHGGEHLSTDQLYSLCYDPEGYIWAGTDGDGIAIFDIKKEKWVKSFRKGDRSNLSSNAVWDIFIDKKGILWTGTEGGGLNRFDKERSIFTSWQFDPSDNASLNGNSVRDILEDSSGRLWIGTWDGGLNRMEREKGSFARYQFDPGTEGSLSDNTVNCIFEDSQGRIWIGTAGGGLNLLDETESSSQNEKKRGLFRTYREADGLAGDNVMGIMEDKSGKLWITTDNGISVFDPLKSAFFTYGSEDGLLDSEFTRKAFCFSSEGVIYAGGTRGISYFRPDDVGEYYYDPPLLMTGLKILNREIAPGDPAPGSGRTVLGKAITETDSIVLTQEDLVLTFSFSILDFIATHRNRYQTFLDGFDREWSSPVNSGSVTYTSLPHGSYTLRVRGENHNGQKLSGELSLDIRILPYFWQTWYFRSATVIFAAGAIFYTVRAKTRQLRRKNEQLSRFSEHIQNAREEERKIAAREVHDELGQILTALKIDIYRFEKKYALKTGQDGAGSMLDLVNRALDSIKALSTSLRPRALDTLSLDEALHWQTLEFQRRTKINCSFRKEKLEDDFDLEISTAVFRIYQEILTNILRHSGADMVDVHIRQTGGKILLTVGDNGRGIPRDKIDSPDSFGLIGMRERCRNFHGRLRITTSDRGTTIEASLPVKGRKRHGSSLQGEAET